MPTQFDWHDEEEDWQLSKAREEPKKRPRRQWRWLPLALLLLLAAGYLINNRLQKQAQEATAAREADIVRSLELMLDAARREDDELFLQLLSGADSKWTESQMTLFRQGQFFDRAAFGLELWDLDLGSPEIAFSPNLREAVVTATLPYQAARSAEIIELQHTWVLRQGTGRWLLAPPDEEFWGETETAGGHRFTLDFYRRDRLLAQRLAADLEPVLERFCALPGRDCPEGWRLHISLTPGAGTLTALPGPFVYPWMSSLATLPTPTLAGRPLDEAGYRRLLDGYAAQVVVIALHSLQEAAAPTFSYQELTAALEQMGLAVPTLLAEKQQADESAVMEVHTAWLALHANPNTGAFYELTRGSDDDWRTAHLALMQNGWFNDRRQFGLYPIEREPQVAEIRFLPLESVAWVLVEEEYLVEMPDGNLEPMEFLQSSFYRREGESWIPDDPGSGFWGHTVQMDGEWLRMFVPARDRELGRRLHTDLEQRLAAICSNQWVAVCSHTVTLELGRQASTLLWRVSYVGAFDTVAIEQPPTLTLWGLPQDEAGYQVLLRTYSNMLLGQLIDRMGTESTLLRHYYGALIERWRVEWGIQSWPVGLPTDEAELPEEPIDFLCLAEDGLAMDLRRYLPAEKSWEIVRADRLFAAYRPLPGVAGVVLQELRVGDDLLENRVILLDDEREIVLLDWSAEERNLLTDNVDGPIIISIDNPDASSGSPPLDYFALNFDLCQSDGCSLQPLPSRLDWSPDGRYTLGTRWAVGGMASPYLGDASGEFVDAIQGSSAVWLDSEHYAVSSRTGEEIAVVEAAGGDKVATVDRTALIDLLGVDSEWRFYIANMIVDPLNPERLLLAAMGSSAGVGDWNAYILSFDWQRRTFEELLVVEQPAVLNLSTISPDGRWLVALLYEYDQPRSTFLLLELVGDSAELTNSFVGDFTFADWLPDSEWLLTKWDNVFLLFNPTENEMYWIVPELPGCSRAAWVR